MEEEVIHKMNRNFTLERCQEEVNSQCVSDDPMVQSMITQELMGSGITVYIDRDVDGVNRYCNRFQITEKILNNKHYIFCFLPERELFSRENNVAGYQNIIGKEGIDFYAFEIDGTHVKGLPELVNRDNVVPGADMAEEGAVSCEEVGDQPESDSDETPSDTGDESSPDMQNDVGSEGSEEDAEKDMKENPYMRTVSDITRLYKKDVLVNAAKNLLGETYPSVVPTPANKDDIVRAVLTNFGHTINE